MSSIRNMPSPDPDADRVADRSTEDRLLDAARDSILSVGWRRTTMTDVARRAGVSRMTVYRTHPDMASLLSDLMTREWMQMLEELGEVPSTQPWPDRIAGLVLGAVRALRANPLFHRIVDVDPELLLPYLLERPGRSQTAVLGLLTGAIRSAQAEGGVRPGDPEVLARSLVLATHGFALSHQTMTTDDVTEPVLDGELVEMTRRFLAR